jgi:hypothetical protein
MKEENNNLIKAILSAGLVAGTLDISAATIQTLLNGGDPLKMLQFVASGVFGKEAFSGGLPYSILGLIFHYIIAFIWTVIFFLVFPRIKLLSKSRLLTGLGYGLFVWFIMNRVVLPLSNISPRPFNLNQAIIGMTILIIAIGLPLSFMAGKYYSKGENN